MSVFTANIAAVDEDVDNELEEIGSGKRKIEDVSTEKLDENSFKAIDPEDEAAEAIDLEDEAVKEILKRRKIDGGNIVPIQPVLDLYENQLAATCAVSLIIAQAKSDSAASSAFTSNTGSPSSVWQDPMAQKLAKQVSEITFGGPSSAKENHPNGVLTGSGTDSSAGLSVKNKVKEFSANSLLFG